MLLLEVADHVFRKLCFRILRVNQIRQLLIDRVTGDVVGPLIIRFRHRSVHATEIDGPRSDVHDESIAEKIEAIGD